MSDNSVVVQCVLGVYALEKAKYYQANGFDVGKRIIDWASLRKQMPSNSHNDIEKVALLGVLAGRKQAEESMSNAIVNGLRRGREMAIAHEKRRKQSRLGGGKK